MWGTTWGFWLKKTWINDKPTTEMSNMWEWFLLNFCSTEKSVTLLRGGAALCCLQLLLLPFVQPRWNFNSQKLPQSWLRGWRCLLDYASFSADPRCFVSRLDSTVANHIATVAAIEVQMKFEASWSSCTCFPIDPNEWPFQQSPRFPKSC